MTEPKIGDVQRDARGAWVIVDVKREVGAVVTSRVLVGSIAHRVHALHDPRIAAVPLDPLLQP